MARRYLFLDESGDLTFSARGSCYFTLASVAADDCQCGNDLIELRRELAWENVHLPEAFHATQDYQFVRDRVFDTICRRSFRVDTTILEKRKAAPHLHSSVGRFYKQALFLHLKHVIPSIVGPGDELLVVCAALGTRRERESHLGNLRDVIDQVAPDACTIRCAFWPASAGPCLQVADYCCWAVHRKWERADERSYALIEERIKSEFEVFARGKVFYY